MGLLQSNLPQLLEKTLREQVRRKIKESLTDWAEVALFPFGQIPAAHHKLLIKHLEAVERREITRLMIWLPPGSAKSTYSSVLFPAWLMSRTMNLNILGASHTADLAEDFSKRVQGMVKEHKDILGYSLSNEAANLWHTSNGGRYRAAGVGGPIAGFRADCVVKGTLVTTPVGEIRIEDLKVGTKTGYVMSYDKENARCEFRRLVAVARRESQDRWRIKSASGNVVEATGNHRFHTERGWVAAASLVVGDVLLRSVRGPGRKNVGGNSQTSGKNAVLQRNLPHQGDKLQPRVSGQKMHNLRRLYGRVAGFARNVLGSLPHGGMDCEGRSFSEAIAGAPMLAMQRGLRPQGESGNRRILQPGLLEQGTRLAHDGGRQSGLAGRPKPAQTAAAFSESISGYSPKDCGARQFSLCGVQRDGKFARSPHQHESIGQSVEKFGDALQRMPFQMARRGEIEAESDAVAMVERVRQSAEVYDIQVEGTESFFANGILVHNCAIVDDPVKNRKDADSPTYRETAYNWFRADLLPRLRPNSAVIVIQTRWHEDDLSGRLLQDNPDIWKVLSLPAIAMDENDALGRAIGEPLWNDDPNYKYGELLENIRQEQGERDWWSLYQQSPRPMSGGIFKTEKITFLEAAPAGMQMVRAWDLASTAATGGRDPDWTAGALIGRTPQGGFVVSDIVHMRGGPDEVEATIVATASRDGRRIQISLPQDPGQAGASQVLYLTRKLSGYKVHTSRETGDKSTRAAPFASQVNVGNVFFVNSPWNKTALNEMAAFPGGSHDDIVDACSRGFDLISNTSISERFSALAS